MDNPGYGDAHNEEEKILETKSRLQLLQIDQTAVNAKV